jgi:DNA-binding NarL/FixJ family response regulator
MKVLVVVEDDSDMRKLIHFLLARDSRLDPTGEASTAEEALAIARQQQPDLVILDHYIDGPLMGIQAAPKIKEAAPAAKILVFSDFDLAAECAAEPAVDAFLHKRRRSHLLETALHLVGLDPAAAS